MNKNIASLAENDKKEKVIKIVFEFDPYTLNCIREIPGRLWHPSDKCWSAPLHESTINQLKTWGFIIDEKLQSYLLQNDKVTKEITVNGIPGLLKTLFPFQTLGVAYIENKDGRALIADEMGCISGDCIINLNRAKRGFKMTLQKAYLKFHGGNDRYKWDEKIPTFATSLINGELRLNEVLGIKHSGIKEVVLVKTEGGKQIKLTPDHELINDKNEWIRTDNLKIGDKILVNGIYHCKNCGSTENITTYKYAKFFGYCKKCICRYFRKNPKLKTGKYMDQDGYIRVSGCFDHHRSGKHSFVYEHILVMEKHLGREINLPEVIHHINGKRHDNVIENLLLTTIKEHQRIHGNYKNFGYFTPKIDTIISIEKAEQTRTFDIVMKEPGRNFVANGIIVHNCGKTVQALGYVQMHRDRIPVIVVCPASLKLNWERETEAWLPNPKVQVLSGTTPYKTKGEILIINYDIVFGWYEELKKKKPQIIILDEVHLLKSSSTKRTKAVKKLCKEVPHIIALSGTPIVNRPIEIYNTLQILDKTLFPNYISFCRRYCNMHNNGFGMDVNGASHTDELHNTLVNTVMIRRKKSDVLKELPDKIYSFVPLALDNTEEYREAEKDFIAYVRREKGNEAADRIQSVEALAKIEGLKQLAVKGKLKDAIEWIKNFLESDQKLVVFCTHKFTIDALMEEFPKISVKIDGSVNMKDRQRAVDVFQLNPKCKLIVLNIIAGGVGLTLTASSNVVFLELPWHSGHVSQAEDRCHRIGQKDSVNVHFLLAQNTIEEKIAKLIDSKRKILDSVLDGKETEQGNLLSEIMNSYL